MFCKMNAILTITPMVQHANDFGVNPWIHHIILCLHMLPQQPNFVKVAYNTYSDLMSLYL
jgi:hypothetical protein